MAIIYEFGFAEGITIPPFSVINGTPTEDTTVVPSGSGPSSLKTDASAVNTNIERNIAGSPTVAVVQFRFYVPSTIPDGYVFSSARVSGTGCNCLFRIDDTTARACRLLLTDGVTTDTSTTFTYSEDTWYRVNVRLNVTANPWTADWQVDGVAQDSVTIASAPTVIVLAGVGILAAGAGALMYWDDWVIATGDTGDYPLPDIHVVDEAATVAWLVA